MTPLRSDAPPYQPPVGQSLKKAIFYFVAGYPGKPGYFAASVDKPESVQQNLDSISKWKSQGAVVSRVSAVEAMAGLDLYLSGCQNRPNAPFMAVALR